MSSIVPYDVPDMEAWNGLILVGEAPGKEEARLGRPFVGRSGQLLTSVLEKAGIERSRCIVANVFRVQPPANKVDHFFISRRAAAQQGVGIAEEYGKFGSAWCMAGFAHDVENLRAMLEAMGKSRSCFIVALGRTPFWALTGENGLLARIGQTFDCRLATGLRVMPTYHPSFILRGNWGLQPAWQKHFEDAARTVA